MTAALDWKYWWLNKGTLRNKARNMYYKILNEGFISVIYDKSTVFPAGVTQGSVRCDHAYNYNLIPEHS